MMSTHTFPTDSTQLLDELAMIYTTCVMFYGVFSHGQTKFTKVLVLILVIFLATFTTLYYHHLKDPLFHQNMFALLTTIVFIRCLYTMEMTLRPSSRAPRAGNESHNMGRLTSKEDKRDLAIVKVMWQMIPVGVGSVALGFLIWNLDNAFCSVLRRWRREIGLPWGILLEGHGWW
jgi:dihydroceramidase